MALRVMDLAARTWEQAMTTTDEPTVTTFAPRRRTNGHDVLEAPRLARTWSERFAVAWTVIAALEVLALLGALIWRVAR